MEVPRLHRAHAARGRAAVTPRARAAGLASIGGAAVSLVLPGLFGQGLLAGAALVGGLVCFVFAVRAIRAKE
jgi:hypothetical protein